MRITFCGNADRGRVCLENILANEKDEVVNVVVHHEDPARKGLVEVAERENIHWYDPKNINSDDSVLDLRSYSPDLMVLAGYNQIIRRNVLDVPSGGCINLHGGKLPDYRGASVLNWAIINGESEIGLSIIYVDEGIDTGDIIAETSFELGEIDTIKEVQERVMNLFPGMLLETLDDIRNGTVERRVQDPQEGNYYRKRKPEDGLINWDNSSRKIYDFVRALTDPYPGAFTFYKGNKVSIWRAQIYEGPSRQIPSGVIARLYPFLISSGDGLLQIEDFSCDSYDVEFKVEDNIGN